MTGNDDYQDTGDNDDDRQMCKPEGCWEV